MYYDYSAANPSYVPEEIDLTTTENFGATETFSDDFDTDDWTDTNTQIAVSGGSIAWNGLRHASLDQGTYYDLGADVSETEWELRYTLNIDNATEGDTNAYFSVGLSDDTTMDINHTPQDYIGLQTYLDTSGGGASNFKAQGINEGILTAGTSFTTADPQTLGLFYVSFKRTSATECIIGIYSDSKYTTLIEEKVLVITSALNNLQYIKMTNLQNASGAGTGVFDGTIDNIQFWNNSLAPDREQSTYDSNYKAVYHLQGNSIDSTAYGNDGTDTAVDWEQQNNSVGLVADGADTEISITDTSLDDMFDGGGIWSVWVNPKSDGESSSARIFNKGNYQFRVEAESGGLIRLKLIADFNTTDGVWSTTNLVLPINELTKIDLIYNSDSIENDPIFILNGIKYTVGNGLTENTKPAGTRVSNTTEFLIANESTATSTFDGLIDNVKLSDKTRPSSEAITSYNAEKSDSDIITKGDELTQ